MKNKSSEKAVWIMLLLLLWHLTAESGYFSELIFPGLDTIYFSLVDSLKNGELLQQLYFSITIIVQGLLISLVLASAAALLANFFTIFASLVDTLTTIAHPLPGIALMPLVLIWFGSGRTAILIVIIHSVLWPLLLNLRTGFESIPEIYHLVAENYRLKKLEYLKEILIPASFPFLLSGMKIAWARSWRALISAEMLFGAINSLGGIGWFIFQKRVFFDLPGVFAGIIVIILIGVFVEDFVFKKIEKATVEKWGMKR